jgi:hypothetical protein
MLGLNKMQAYNPAALATRALLCACVKLFSSETLNSDIINFEKSTYKMRMKHSLKIRDLFSFISQKELGSGGVKILKIILEN